MKCLSKLRKCNILNVLFFFILFVINANSQDGMILYENFESDIDPRITFFSDNDNTKGIYLEEYSIKTVTEKDGSYNKVFGFGSSKKKTVRTYLNIDFGEEIYLHSIEIKTRKFHGTGSNGNIIVDGTAYGKGYFGGSENYEIKDFTYKSYASVISIKCESFSESEIILDEIKIYGSINSPYYNLSTSGIHLDHSLRKYNNSVSYQIRLDDSEEYYRSKNISGVVVHLDFVYENSRVNDAISPIFYPIEYIEQKFEFTYSDDVKWIYFRFYAIPINNSLYKITRIGSFVIKIDKDFIIQNTPTPLLETTPTATSTPIIANTPSPTFTPTPASIVTDMNTPTPTYKEQFDDIISIKSEDQIIGIWDFKHIVTDTSSIKEIVIGEINFSESHRFFEFDLGFGWLDIGEWHLNTDFPTSYQLQVIFDYNKIHPELSGEVKIEGYINLNMNFDRDLIGISERNLFIRNELIYFENGSFTAQKVLLNVKNWEVY